MALRLGCCDKAIDVDKATYLRKYHDWNLTKPLFRKEITGEWWGFRAVPGTEVAILQQQLRDIGFYPKGEIDSIYGYRTQSSVRLFQEYVRTIEALDDIGDVDGIAGNKTQQHIERWLREGQIAAWTGTESDHKKSLTGLRQLQQYFASSNLRGIQLLNEHASNTASLAVADWQYNATDIHLIGIRRNENDVYRDDAGVGRRRNEDIFVLLVAGMRLVFRGSTNPNPVIAKRPDQPFLIRGQHRFRFGWHKIRGTEANPSASKVYRAFKPKVPAGPLIVRAVGDLLTDESFERASANPAINIHWSGSGTVNWSAGCQVMAGKKYINFRNELVDLSARAAPTYTQLNGKKTRGAYNVLLDLITVFAYDARPAGDTLYYTLLYERDIRLTETGGAIDFDDLVSRLS